MSPLRDDVRFHARFVNNRRAPDAHLSRTRGEMEAMERRNDYLTWIARAKRDETRRSRITQMFDELEQGGVYMKMDHPPSGAGAMNLRELSGRVPLRLSRQSLG